MSYISIRKQKSEQRMDFLWVRWMGIDPQHKFGWAELRLPHLTFIHDEDDTPSYGFIDPKEVIRAAHLIPVFTTEAAMKPANELNPLLNDTKLTKAYSYFYVNW